VSPDPGERGPHRYRSLVVAGTLVVAVIAAGLLAGKHGGGPSGASVHARFGPLVRLPGTTGDLVYTNGWAVTSGAQLLGVYVGSQRSHRGNGLFMILRQTRGRRYMSRVVIRGSGAVTLLRPAQPDTESAARSETLHFVTASGSTGTLGLSTDKVTLSH
jgi:hypothetical protein